MWQLIALAGGNERDGNRRRQPGGGHQNRSRRWHSEPQPAVAFRGARQHRWQSPAGEHGGSEDVHWQRAARVGVRQRERPSPQPPHPPASAMRRRAAAVRAAAVTAVGAAACSAAASPRQRCGVAPLDGLLHERVDCRPTAHHRPASRDRDARAMATEVHLPSAQSKVVIRSGAGGIRRAPEADSIKGYSRGHPEDTQEGTQGHKCLSHRTRELHRIS